MTPTTDVTAGMSPHGFVLASGSPQRRALLTEAGYAFVVHPADIDESDVPAGLAPGDVAELLAVRKAAVVAARFPDDVVLAADTVVSLHGRPLGKPTDAAHAFAMLTDLAGTTHACITGMCVSHGGRSSSRRVESTIRTRPLSPAEVRDYVATGEWRGKAGGYGIQNRDPFVIHTAGSRTNIIGLPMDETRAMLAAAGIVPTLLPR